MERWLERFVYAAGFVAFAMMLSVMIDAIRTLS